jgi:hypothetical protein
MYMNYRGTSGGKKKYKKYVEDMVGRYNKEWSVVSPRHIWEYITEIDHIEIECSCGLNSYDSEWSPVNKLLMNTTMNFHSPWNSGEYLW